MHINLHDKVNECFTSLIVKTNNQPIVKTNNQSIVKTNNRNYLSEYDSDHKNDEIIYRTAESPPDDKWLKVTKDEFINCCGLHLGIRYEMQQEYPDRGMVYILVIYGIQHNKKICKCIIDVNYQATFYIVSEKWNNRKCKAPYGIPCSGLCDECQYRISRYELER